MDCRRKAGFTYRLSRLKPSIGENGGLITNNEDLFFFSPILLAENRTSEDECIILLGLHYTDIFRENRTSENVKIFFALLISVMK